MKKIILGLLALSLLVPMGGCSKKADKAAAGKVMIIGLDGAEWDLLKPMVEEGELPNFARIMDEGIYGNLRSLEPAQKSPAIWTTIATGKTPEEHGIKTFVDRKRGGAPLTQNVRKTRALWNILSGLGRTVGVVGWLVTWPAEEVNGFVVSDYLQYGPGKSSREDKRTHPAELENELLPLIKSWEDIPWSEVQPMLSAPLDEANIDAGLNALLRPIRMYTAADESFARIGMKLYKEQQPDFFSVYFRGMDTMGHLYWNYMIPESVPENFLNPAGKPYLKGAMRGYYRYVDGLIKPYLDAMDEETTLIVVSDHGFKGGTEGGIGAHKLDGILMMMGRGIGQGEITGATVYDITPTTLVLMGLPPAEDMRGKVLWAAFDETVPREKFSKLIATYETGDRTGGDPIQSPLDDEIKERLRSLGYID